MKFFKLAPPMGISVLVFLISLPLGLATYTFYYAEGYSYFSNKPEACINCHIMKDHYNAWNKGSHHGSATCNDCHTPRGIVAKYMSKAANGFWHSLAFTNGRFIEPLQIKKSNRKIVEASCRHCHSQWLEASHFSQLNVGTKSCLHCHHGVGHNLKM